LGGGGEGLESIFALLLELLGRREEGRKGRREGGMDE